MNYSLNQELCEIAQYLAQNKELQSLLIIRSIIAIFGILFFFILFKIQGVYLAFHSNARILLIGHHMWAILLSAVNLCAHIFDLIRYSAKYSDPCKYLMTTVLSVLVRGPDLICVYSEVFILTMMAFERCMATVKFRSYESSNGTLGKCLIVLQVSNYQLHFTELLMFCMIEMHLMHNYF
jgi:hypothetical protein